MPLKIEYKELVITLADIQDLPDPEKGPSGFDQALIHEKDQPYTPVSQIAITVYKNNQKISSVLLSAAGGATRVSTDSVLIDENQLITRCCNKMFCLQLPDLQLKWITESDGATCFSIRQYKDSYISHGEMSIARISRAGEILWSFGGRDIFVSLDGYSCFEMQEDQINLRDYNGNYYTINYNGNSIDFKELPNAPATEADVQQFRDKYGLKTPRAKAWWKFW